MSKSQTEKDRSQAGQEHVDNKPAAASSKADVSAAGLSVQPKEAQTSSGRMELRLTGSGGQGVILASVILAEAAIIAGKYTAQSQSYGPEARGGACKAETLISENPIGFTKVQSPTFLMALTQKSLDKYSAGLEKDCLVLIDEDLTPPECIADNKVIALPILRTAREDVGRQQTANIVAVGCINELLHLADNEHIKEAVQMHIPAGTEKLNMQALKAGQKLAQEYLKKG